MTTLTENEVLRYLKDNFSKFASSDHDARGVDRQLAVYTASLARQIEASPFPATEHVIPPQMTGLRRRYLEAVRNNAIAKQEFAASIRRVQVAGPRPDLLPSRKDSTPRLTSHLGLLYQQRLYDKLSTVERYLNELDGLAACVQLKGGGSFSNEHHSHTAATMIRLASFHDDATQIRDLITKLELAVVKAEYECKQEKTALQAAHGQVQTIKGLNPNAEFQALSAVRDELTAWLEQSLTLCASAEDADDDVNEVEPGQIITAEQVEEQYEQYLKARQRVLTAADRLSKVSPRDEPKIMQVPRPELKPAIRHLTDHVLPTEASYQKRQLENSIKQIHTYAVTEIESESQDAQESLVRLADESQLLPEYPRLSKSERFGKVTNSLGARQIPTNDDRVTEQVEAWSFAAAAADNSLEAIIQGHVKNATKALDGVDETLRDLTFLGGQKV